MFVYHSRWRPHAHLPDQVWVDEGARTGEIIDPEALAELEQDYKELEVMVEGMKGIAFGGAVSSAMANDFDEIIRLVEQHKRALRLELTDLARFDDDGGCQRSKQLY